LANTTTEDIREEEMSPDFDWLMAYENDEITANDMRIAGDVLSRFADILRAQRRDY
jgi:hypothetical protein